MEELLRNNCILIICCLIAVIIVLILIVIFYFRELKKQDLEIYYLKGQLKRKSQIVKSQKVVRTIQNSSQPNRGSQHNSEEELKDNDNVSPAKSDQDDTLIKDDKISCIYHYLQEASGGKFFKLLSAPDKCFFRTWEENGVRKYEFYGNVDKALANMNAIFDDVCDIEGKRGGATAIENVSPGTLDSDLRITLKAKIRLK